jgi:hypothetical protein
VSDGGPLVTIGVPVRRTCDERLALVERLDGERRRLQRRLDELTEKSAAAR